VAAAVASGGDGGGASSMFGSGANDVLQSRVFSAKAQVTLS
jgi:hypothetical protein